MGGSVGKPVANEVFAEVRREEHRRRVMLGDSPSLQLESFAMAAHFNNFASQKKPCGEHCNKSYHTQDTCWDIHGKQADWVNNRLRKKGPTSRDQRIGTPPSIVNFS